MDHVTVSIFHAESPPNSHAEKDPMPLTTAVTFQNLSSSEGLALLMESQWLRAETHSQHTHLSWCAGFHGNDVQNYKFKGHNGQNHQANRDIIIFL